MRKLDMQAARAAALGGLVFGAGGGGLERGLRAAEAVFQLGRPVLATLDELADDDGIVVMTSVGAPGLGQQRVWPRHGLRALKLLADAWNGQGRIAGIMASHPGAFMPGTWLPAALDPHLVVVDCATNGRGHPTVQMGAMGVAGRDDVQFLQAGAGGVEEDGSYLEIVVRGTAAATADLLHHASTQAGGAIAACRGPFSASFCREAGAVGAVSRCMQLGEAMLAAEAPAERVGGAAPMIAAVVDTLGGHELGRGHVVRHELTHQGNWEVGGFAVATGSAQLEISVCNEYMSADLDGRRVATFPDLIVVLSSYDGMPLAAARLQVGDEVVIIAVPKARIPLGAGVRDASVYGEVERLIGKDLASYALNGAAIS